MIGLSRQEAIFFVIDRNENDEHTCHSLSSTFIENVHILHCKSTLIHLLEMKENKMIPQSDEKFMKNG